MKNYVTLKAWRRSNNCRNVLWLDND